MNIKEAVRGYGAAAKALHWLTAVLVVLQVTLALRAWKLPPGSVKNALLGQHMSVGLCVLLMTIVRLGWRRQHGAPALPESISPRPRWAARVNHGLLYALLLLLPLSGWTMVSAAGIAPSLFGIVPLPALLATNAESHQVLKLVHLTLNTLLFFALPLHVGAALWHGLRRDGVFARMLPGAGHGPAA